MTSHKDSAPQFADDELDASDDVEDLEAAEEKAATRQTPMQKYGFMLLTTAVFLGLWEIGVIITEQPQYLLPKPTVILNVMIERWPLWIDHGWVTLMEVLGGFGLAILVGIPLAILIVYSRLLEAIIYPPLVAFQAVPKIAIAPLFIVWFGFGFSPKLLIAFLIAFFPIVISTVVGLRSINPEMLQLARSMGAGNLKTFLWLRLPNALPSIFGGLKVAITLAVVGAIVGEFVGADQGLGYILLVAGGNLQTPLLFAALVVLSALAVILFILVEVVEKIAMPWHQSERTREVGM